MKQCRCLMFYKTLFQRRHICILLWKRLSYESYTELHTDFKTALHNYYRERKWKWVSISRINMYTASASWSLNLMCNSNHQLMILEEELVIRVKKRFLYHGGVKPSTLYCAVLLKNMPYIRIARSWSVKILKHNIEYFL